VTDKRSEIAECYVCGGIVVDDEIVRYRLEGIWRRWCWPCFKRSHLTNLTRLQEENQ
jgi:hypothetical protein